MMHVATGFQREERGAPCRPGSLSQTAPQGEVSPLPCIRAGGLEHHPTVTPTPPTRKLEDQGSLWFSERGAL